MRILAAALCAASFLTAPVAQAATIFEFRTVGTGTAVVPNPGSSNPIYVPLVDLVFKFRLSDSTPIDASPAGSRFVTSISDGSANSTGFTLNERSPAATASISACYGSNLLGFFPRPGFSAATTCGGSVSFRSEGPLSRYLGQYTGSVVSFSVYTGEEDASFPSAFITPAVPEPSTWALMLAGFGLAGYALRRRRARVAFA